MGILGKGNTNADRNPDRHNRRVAEDNTAGRKARHEVRSDVQAGRRGRTPEGTAQELDRKTSARDLADQRRQSGRKH